MNAHLPLPTAVAVIRIADGDGDVGVSMEDELVDDRGAKSAPVLNASGHGHAIARVFLARLRVRV